MTGKQITIIKYLALKVKIAMNENKINVKFLSLKTEQPEQSIIKVIGNCSDLSFSYAFSLLVKLSMALMIWSIFFDENDIVNLYIND